MKPVWFIKKLAKEIGVSLNHAAPNHFKLVQARPNFSVQNAAILSNRSYKFVNSFILTRFLQMRASS